MTETRVVPVEAPIVGAELVGMWWMPRSQYRASDGSSGNRAGMDGASLLVGHVLEAAPLRDGEAHLWCVRPDVVDDAAVMQACYELLSPEERAQQRRFYFATARHQYLVAHAFVRTVLSLHAEVRPEAWKFRKNRYGRPEIAEPRTTPPIRFNLSHTDGLIACGVALGRRIGVDVEDTRRTGSTVELADRFFSRPEVAALHAQPPDARRTRFFEYWTLKESYVKARGIGLSLPLEQFAIHLEEPDPITIAFAPRVADDPATWQFRLFRPTPWHVLAIALGRGRGPDWSVRLNAVARAPHGTSGALTKRWELRTRISDPAGAAARWTPGPAPPRVS